MKRFAIVCAQEFREAVRSKPFRIISVFLAILLIAAAAAGFFLLADEVTVTGGQNYADFTDDGSATADTDGFSYYYAVAVDDRTEGDTLERLRLELPYIRFVEMSSSDEEIEAMLTNGECDAYIVLRSERIFEIYEQVNMYSESLGEDIRAALVEMGRVEMLGELGVDAAQAEEVLGYDDVWYTQHAVGGYDLGKYIYNYVMVILMYMVIALYGQMVASRVATEKSSRTMEVLATSVSPTELLCGKVIGVGLAGLLQMSVFIGAAVAIVRSLLARSEMLSLVAGQILNITGFDIACMVLFFVLGFLVYAFIFGALGSMVSSLEDLSGTASMPMYIFMIGYFISLFSSIGGEVGIVMKVASFVPFWSPVVMFARMTVENVPVIELAISLVLLVITAAATSWLSARIYRTGMLRYGKPPRMKEIINAARNGK